MKSPRLILQLTLLAAAVLGALVAAAAWRVEATVSPAWLAHLPAAVIIVLAGLATRFIVARHRRSSGANSPDSLEVALHRGAALGALRDAFIAALAAGALMLYADPERVVVAWLLLGYAGLVAADYWIRYGIARSDA